MWVSEMTVGMRPSFTSYWAYTNKSQIIPFCGVRGILPADACPAQNSPLADFCLSVSVHSNTPPSNSIQALCNAISILPLLTGSSCDCRQEKISCKQSIGEPRTLKYSENVKNQNMILSKTRE